MNDTNAWLRAISEPEASDDETIRLSLVEALGGRLRHDIKVGNFNRSAKTLSEARRLIFELAKDYEIEFIENRSLGAGYQGGGKKDLILLKDAVISFGIFTFKNPQNGQNKTRIFLYPEKGRLFQEACDDYLAYLKGKLLSMVFGSNPRPPDREPLPVAISDRMNIQAPEREATIALAA